MNSNYLTFNETSSKLAHLFSLVDDSIEFHNVDIAKVEKLLPPPEEPAIPSTAEAVNIAKKTELAVAESDNIIKSAEKIIANEEVKKTVPPQLQEIKKEIQVEIVEESKTNSKPSIVEEKKLENNVKVVVKEVKKETSSKKEIKENVAKIASGMWQIQLISSPNQSAIEKSWADLTKKYSQLQGLPHEIESADLGTKGTFYRLKAGTFTTRGEADKLCNSIKSSGGSCLVKKKQ